jgi:DNA-binding NarL/FixJ family response regulator
MVTDRKQGARHTLASSHFHLNQETTMLRGERYGSRIPTTRELEVIRLVAYGLKNIDVAASIGTTENVIKNYLRAIYDKLGLWNRVELALWYMARQHESRNSTGTSSAVLHAETL